jgi:hypothetical protein
MATPGSDSKDILKAEGKKARVIRLSGRGIRLIDIEQKKRGNFRGN